METLGFGEGHVVKNLETGKGCVSEIFGDGVGGDETLSVVIAIGGCAMQLGGELGAASGEREQRKHAPQQRGHTCIDWSRPSYSASFSMNGSVVFCEHTSQYPDTSLRMSDIYSTDTVMEVHSMTTERTK